ncbi:uncharacterized protein VTP21DRAFT_3683 [Calcarisporiella thermophila]|uniref:uncharacterized protein n=1 Tax=Calcarisporiella thermophila TaxID=911321 RepID=UPI00374390CF
MSESSTTRAKKDPLDPSHVLLIFNSSLPSAASTSSGPNENIQLRNPQDAITGLIHAVFTALGFRLIGLGEDGRIEQNEGEVQNLPVGWNTEHALRYKHTQSSLTFLVKTIKMGDKVVVHGTSLEDSKIATLEIKYSDFLSTSFFPYPNPRNETLAQAFNSGSRLLDLISLIKLQLVQRLLPGLNKEGYEETTTSNVGESSSSRQPPESERDPLRAPPPRPYRPPIHGEPLAGDEPLGRNPFRIGDADLDPLGANPIYGPPRFGGGGIGPFGEGIGGIGGGEGGMYVGPNHPIFGGGSRGDPAGIYGGPQPLPRGAVPPGARFDPIGPFGAGRGRGIGRGRGRGGGMGSFSGEPDNDEFPPPGFGHHDII